MKASFYILITLLLFTSCSYRIVQTGYSVSKTDYTNCDIVIKKFTTINDSLATKVGEIKLGETGFSVSCSEAHAIKILKGEACAINSNLIIITKESRPDLWSSCYRCSAEFYRFNNQNIENAIKSDRGFNTKHVETRVTEDKSKNTAALIGGIVAGFLVGFFLFF